ncbi:hypothetical protein ACFO26_00430 [Lactococcus nasutitermitis]|uniref:Uncharacterized protein n=1 Tax=Lactococcus nasutitermitis TaxID=1652957 RepID=A0ABV9J9R3_9LACT|nr:hypothetical protein [Lactococcus nasutitermitis]
MSELDFKEQLKKMRELYLENHPIDKGENEVFTPLSIEEKEKKLLDALEHLTSKIAYIKNEIAKNDSSSKSLDDLKEQLEIFENKRVLFEQKLDFIKNGDYDDARREKLKRQLTELELKRCKLKLSQKDCSKVNQKIKQKSELFKKLK